MKRYEIIVNRSVQYDLLALLKEAGGDLNYSLFPQVFGRGRQGMRNGDSIWPETNISLVCYTKTVGEGEAIVRAVRALKKHFPAEGIKLFAVPVDEVELDTQ